MCTMYKWKCIICRNLVTLTASKSKAKLKREQFGVVRARWKVCNWACSMECVQLDIKQGKNYFFANNLFPNFCQHLRIIIWQNQHKLHQSQKQSWNSCNFEWCVLDRKYGIVNKTWDVEVAILMLVSVKGIIHWKINFASNHIFWVEILRCESHLAQRGPKHPWHWPWFVPTKWPIPHPISTQNL